jgi:2-hydroxy-3-oxopropionate reductase
LRAASVTQAVADADIAAVMVPDSSDVAEVLAKENGIFDKARPGTPDRRG